MGFFLSLMGKAEKLSDISKNRTLYIDTENAIEWLKQKGIRNLNFYGVKNNFFAAFSNATNIARLDQEIQLNPQDARALYLRGLFYAERGDRKRAIQDLQDSFNISPNDNHKCRCLDRKAEILIEERSEDSLQKALKDFSEIEKIQPQFQGIWGTPIERKKHVKQILENMRREQ